MSEFRLPSPLPTHLLLLPPSLSPRLPSHLSCKPPAPVLYQLQLLPLWPLCSPSFIVLCPDIFLSHPSHLTFIPPAFTPGIFLLHTAWVLSRNDSLNRGQIPDSLGTGNKRSLSCRKKSFWSLIVQGWNIFCCSLGIPACLVLVHPLIATAQERWVPLWNKPPFKKCLANTESPSWWNLT